MSGDPYPKSRQLARGERRYRRKVASPKQWQAIIAAKAGPCRACGGLDRPIQFHHLVSRAQGGDDVADNILPLCDVCHGSVTVGGVMAVRYMGETLTDAEYAYAIGKAGEDFFERAYGLEYTR